MASWTYRAEGETTGGPKPDLDEARLALSLLVKPEFGVEIRGLPSGRSRVHLGSDLDGLCRSVAELSDGAGVYWTLNPLRPGMPVDKAARVADVVRRRWLLLDIDRRKTKENKKLSATRTEKDAAKALALLCADFLAGIGWPAPVLIDSGNGWHLLYRIDLPADAVSQERLRLLLRALAARLDTVEADIDQAVHDAVRISKLPGTWARKGQNLPDRPWRMAHLVRVPEPLEVVSDELLKRAMDVLAPLSTERPAPAPAPAPWKLTCPPGNGNGYGRKALQDECTRLFLVPDHLNNAMARSAFRMGQLVGSGLLDEEEVFVALLAAARGAGADSPRKDESCLRRAIEAGKKKPRKNPPPSGSTPAVPPAIPPKFPPGESLITRASEIPPEKVQWLWPGRIPLGMLTTFAGVTSLGKTFMLCDIAARVSTGRDWPDSGGECSPEGQVLFMTGEDSLAHTVVPRLIEAGADLAKVVFLKSAVQDRITLADLDVLDEAIRQAGGGFRLIAIDPPTAFLGDVDDHKNSELRRLLSPLKSWAEMHLFAVVFITHFNKKSGENVDALSRVMGSVAWVAGVRAAHMFIKDQDDPDRRLFLPLKLNVAKEAKGLAYSIEERGELAVVKWLGTVETTADETSKWTNTTKRKQTRADRAVEWLIERFREKTMWPSEELFQTGKQEGISQTAIYQAKEILELPKARRISNPDASVHYVWWVPDNWPPLAPAGEN